jgi:hypothetical protein
MEGLQRNHGLHPENNRYRLQSLQVIAFIRSDKPLTLGDAMDRAVVSRTWRYLSDSEETWQDVAKHVTLAEKIDGLTKRYGLFKPSDVQIELPIEATTIYPLFLTPEELLLYKPAENWSS